MAGELYLFHPSDPACPDASSLWGMFGTRDLRGTLRLESASADLFRFRFGVELAPREYPFCRLASRDELRDYCYNLAVYESAVCPTLSVSVRREP
ncbi:MAG: hypothetical protein J6K95_05585 [Rikenellaceae bacterium]|nr:hypothetical protein [Rikenellaceae bacterium]